MAGLLDQLVGHQRQKNRLLESLRQERLASSFLFVGPSGIGKKQLALGLAQTLICDQANLKDQTGACGQCPSCVRLSRGQNENILMIEPEEAAQIKIDQARKAIQFLTLKIWGKARVVIIDQAQKMTAQAANALLKSLEEPPPHSYFILIATSDSDVLPTIRSRSQVVRFSSLSKSELQQITGADSWVLESAQGQVKRVEQLMEKDHQELRAQAFEAWSVFIEKSSQEAFECVKNKVKDKQQSLFIICLWQQLLRDAVFQQNNIGAPIHLDQTSLIERLGVKFKESLHQLMQSTFDLEKEIMSNLDRGLCFEHYFLQAKKLTVQ